MIQPARIRVIDTERSDRVAPGAEQRESGVEADAALDSDRGECRELGIAEVLVDQREVVRL